MVECGIFADITVALGIPKFGHLLSPGIEHTGKLITAGIGLPEILLNADTLKNTLIDDEFAASLLLPRPRVAHKGSCGRVLVVCGSQVETYTTGFQTY